MAALFMEEVLALRMTAAVRSGREAEEKEQQRRGFCSFVVRRSEQEVLDLRRTDLVMRASMS